MPGRRTIGEDNAVDDWQVEFLELCADSDGVALGDGAFAP
jgi:hypothetical protein